MGEKNEHCVQESSENGCAKSMTSVCIPSLGIVAGERGEGTSSKDGVIHPRVEISSALPLGDYVIRASCLLPLLPPPLPSLPQAVFYHTTSCRPRRIFQFELTYAQTQTASASVSPSSRLWLRTLPTCPLSCPEDSHRCDLEERSRTGYSVEVEGRKGRRL